MDEGRLEATESYFFSADEGADVGCDEATPVTPDYKNGESEFSGTIHKVVVLIQPVKQTAEQHILHKPSPGPGARETEGRHEPGRMPKVTLLLWA